MPSNHTYDEKALFGRIAQGDEEAFNTLFHAYVPRLHAIIMKVTRTEWVVKDIIQEVFLYLWIDRERLTDVEIPQNWIFRIAYNRCYSWLARQSLRSSKLEELERRGSASTENNLETVVALQETIRLIHEATAQLPSQSKRIFQLSRENGLKAAEIAEQLGISVQTVRNSLVRSVKFVREYLARQGVILPALLLCSLV